MNGKKNGLAFTSILTAASASLCCITPVLALISGTSGAASTFSWMEPFRPYLIAVTLLVLIFAWYQKLKPKKIVADDCGCEVERPNFFRSRKFLAIITAFSFLMLAFPYYSKSFYPTQNIPKSNPDITMNTVEFQIEGMTCQGCEEHIDHAVSKLGGISQLKTSYDENRSTISFDPEQTSIPEIENAINETGYHIIGKIEKSEQSGD